MFHSRCRVRGGGKMITTIELYYMLLVSIGKIKSSFSIQRKSSRMRFDFRRKVLVCLLTIFIYTLFIHLNYNKFENVPLETTISHEITITPTIFVVTPTYQRNEQLADLTRMGQTLMHDENIFWIVVEDSDTKSGLVQRLLERIGPHLAGYVQLATPTVEKQNPNLKTHQDISRGGHQRNIALKWISENRQLLDQKSHGKAYIYFADDDNTYDIRLFDKIRKVKNIGIWPVGLIARSLYEGPICDPTNSFITGWRSNYMPERFCCCDMASFAFSLQFYLEAKDVFFDVTLTGAMEDDFLKRLVFHDRPMPANATEALTYLEPIVCNEILV